ncbi:ras protein [Mycena capillaripes]|nr:ras protein [Mycena capillaripes]
MPSETDQWAVTLLGDNGAGKTSLAYRIYDPTIEDHYVKQLYVNNRLCLVEVIDPALRVSEEGWGFRDSWVQRGQAALLVYSIASRATFDRLESFRHILKRVKGEDAILILVGNKCDLEARREVTQEEGAALALQLGCEFIETSAKTGHNVDRAVAILVQTLRGPTEPVAPAETKPKPTKWKRSCIIL